jgi:hypothetical protein
MLRFIRGPAATGSELVGQHLHLKANLILAHQNPAKTSVLLPPSANPKQLAPLPKLPKIARSNRPRNPTPSLHQIIHERSGNHRPLSEPPHGNPQLSDGYYRLDCNSLGCLYGGAADAQGIFECGAGGLWVWDGGGVAVVHGDE